MIALKSHQTALNLALHEMGRSAGEREVIPDCILGRTLELMLADQKYASAVHFIECYPTLLTTMRGVNVNCPIVDFEGLRDRFPSLARFLRLRRDRARALARSYDGHATLVETADERAVRLLEDRLAEIRAEVQARAIGAPFR